MHIDFGGLQSRFVVHMQKNFAVGGRNHACTAYLFGFVQGNRRTDYIGIGVICQKSGHQRQSTVRIASLVRTADNHIEILPCQIGKIFIKIEIITNEKSEPNAVYFQNGRRGMFKRIRTVQFHDRNFARDQMLFVISSRFFAFAVKRIGRVSIAFVGFGARIYENDGSASFCRFRSFLQQCRIIFFHALFRLFFRFGKARNVTAFRHDNEIHRTVALIQQIQFVLKIRIGFFIFR